MAWKKNDYSQHCVLQIHKAQEAEYMTQIPRAWAGIHFT